MRAFSIAAARALVTMPRVRCGMPMSSITYKRRILLLSEYFTHRLLADIRHKRLFPWVYALTRQPALARIRAVSP